MHDRYEYRVKFTDIRVKPPSGKKSAIREPSARVCQHEGCKLPGEFPAPSLEGKGRHWFCKRHASEHNRRFNFFNTMTEEELKTFNEEARYGFKQTWKLGSGPLGVKARGRAQNGADPACAEDEQTAKGNRRIGRSATSAARRALAELDLDATADPARIRTRYAEYVRRFHPDSNSGNRSSEDKLARVIRAGKALKAAGLMRD